MKIENNDILTMEISAKYKARIPDPGVCRILAIDWEECRVVMSNGAFRYYPLFEEIDIIRYNKKEGKQR